MTTAPTGGAIPILSLETVDSTNAEAVRRAEAGETGPLWITARHQTAGRGRRGRTWRGDPRNLAASLLMVTDRPPADAAQISFIAALAVSDLARAFLAGEPVTLKWPNDLLIDGRKAAGVLVESGRHASGRLWLVTGVGVNLARAPEDVDRPATSFADHCVTPPSPRQAIERLAEAFARWMAVWAAEGFAPIAQAWTQRAHGLGEACRAHLPNETLEGVAEGLDSDGALLLRTRDGQARRITAGDVFFGRA